MRRSPVGTVCNTGSSGVVDNVSLSLHTNEVYRQYSAPNADGHRDLRLAWGLGLPMILLEDEYGSIACRRGCVCRGRSTHSEALLAEKARAKITAVWLPR